MPIAVSPSLPRVRVLLLPGEFRLALDNGLWRWWQDGALTFIDPLPLIGVGWGEKIIRAGMGFLASRVLVKERGARTWGGPRQRDVK